MEFESLESVSAWSVYQVAHFVNELVGTGIYSQVLKENNINGKALLNCTLEGWQQYGIQKLAHRAALYGWVQGRINSYQEKVNMQRRISMESSNKARHKQLRKPNETEAAPNHQVIEKDDKYKKVPAKAILKESYSSQSRVWNDNMKDLREWFKDGVGKFSRHEFLTGNLKKNAELKTTILEVIERRKEELTKLIVDGEECAWSTQEIFAKVLTHRNYLKKAKLEAKVEKPCGGEGDSKGIPSIDYVYVPTMEEENHMDFQVDFQPIMEDVSHNIPTTSTSLCVTMFGSPFHIPEQVIQFRQERLVARKSIIQYHIFQEIDEGMIGFGGSILLQKLMDGPYERWEVEVTDLAIGIGMKTLLIPGTRRPASTIKIGERLILPAVYLLMGESVPDSVINRTEDDNTKCDAQSSDAPSITFNKKQEMKVLEESSHSEDQRSDFQHDRGKEVLEEFNHNEDQRLDFQHDRGKEVFVCFNEDSKATSPYFQHNEYIEAGNIIDDNDPTMQLIASNVSDDITVGNINVELTCTSTMGNQNHVKPGVIAEKLLHKYHSINMNSSLARQASFCTEEAFKKKREELGDVESREVNTSSHEFESDIAMADAPKEKKFLSLNSNLVQAGFKKRVNTKKSGRNAKKVLKDVTNSMLGSPERVVIQGTKEAHVPVVRGRHERVVKVPSRYKN